MKRSRIILKKYCLFFFLLLFPGKPLMVQEEVKTGFQIGIQAVIFLFVVFMVPVIQA